MITWRARMRVKNIENLRKRGLMYVINETKQIVHVKLHRSNGGMNVVNQQPTME